MPVLFGASFWDKNRQRTDFESKSGFETSEKAKKHIVPNRDFAKKGMRNFQPCSAGSRILVRRFYGK